MKILTVTAGATQDLSIYRSRLQQMPEREFQDVCKYFESWFGEGVHGAGRAGRVDCIMNMTPVKEPGGLLDFLEEVLSVTASAMTKALNRTVAGWWDDMSPEARKQYLKDHPNSKYAGKGGKKLPRRLRDQKEAQKDAPKKSINQRIFEQTKKANGYTDQETREHLRNRGPEMDDLDDELIRDIEEDMRKGPAGKKKAASKKPAPKKPDPTGIKDPKKSPSYQKALKEYEDHQKKKKLAKLPEWHDVPKYLSPSPAMTPKEKYAYHQEAITELNKGAKKAFNESLKGGMKQIKKLLNRDTVPDPFRVPSDLKQLRNLFKNSPRLEHLNRAVEMMKIADRHQNEQRKYR